VSNSYNQLKEKTLLLINKMLEFEGIKGSKEYIELLSSVQNKLINEKIIVVVAGEFKQGKSSLINAYLNEREHTLFPVDVEVTTNLVTTISYDREEKINVILGPSGKEKKQRIQREEIKQYVTEQQNKGNKMEAKMLVVESPNPLLKDGLTIVDTPGVGSMNPEHSAITYAFIPNADAVIYASDAQTPLSETELDFIQRIYKHCKNFIFVVTKIDLVRDYQGIIQDNRNKLTKFLKEQPENIKIVPVSSRAKSDYLKDGEEDDLIDSNFTLLEETLGHIIRERRAELMLMPALGTVGKTILDLKRPFVVEWNACQQENKQKTLEKQNELQEAIKQKQQFMEKNAEWIMALSDGMKKLQQSVNYDFDMGLSDIQQKANTYFEDNKKVAKPGYLLSLIESDINSFMIDTSENIMKRAAQLHGQLSELTGLNINQVELEELGFQFDDEDKEIQAKRVDKFRKSVAAVKGGAFNLTYAGGFGAVLGGIIGGVAGTLLGPAGTYAGAYYGAMIGGGLIGIAGAFTGAKDAISNLDDKDRTVIKNKIVPVMNDSYKKCRYIIAEVFGNLEKSLRDDLREQIKIQKVQYEEMLEKLKAAAAMSSEDAAERSKTIERSIKTINDLYKQFEAVAIEVKSGIEVAEKTSGEQTTHSARKSMDWADM